MITRVSETVRRALQALLVSMPMALAVADDDRPGPAQPSLVCLAYSQLHCFDGASLEPRWRTPAGPSYDSSPAAGEITLAAGSSGIVAFDADGRERWRHGEFGPVFAPRRSADAVYLGTLEGRLLRLDAAAGTVVWQRRLPGWVYSPALLRDRVVTGGSAGRLFALDRASGERLWTRELGQELVYRPVEAGDDAVIATTFDGAVTMFGLDGERRWQRKFEVAARSPVIVGERLYASLFDGRLVALALADGRLLWQRSFAGPLELVVDGDGLLAYDVDQAVALDRHGELLWRRRFTDELLGVRLLNGGDRVAFLRRANGLLFASRLESPGQ